MNEPIDILLQTTIEPTENDWHIGRFSMLREYLASLETSAGSPLFRVTARNRNEIGAPDPVLSSLERSVYDELWLFAVDTGDGLHEQDREGILRFRARGGGLLITRDHMDLGCSICTLGAVGAAHVFHTHNAAAPIPPPDDTGTPEIQWPNFHSGANGAIQRVEAELPMHPVMRDRESETGKVMYLPAHPHEGAVIAPKSDPLARVIATGRSLASGARFNIAVAFERSDRDGPAIAESTFHHFADYNWDPSRGSPDFVSENPVFDLPNTPRAIASVQCYVRNVALWLAGEALMRTPTQEVTAISTHLARWYAAHSCIRRIRALEDPIAISVFVTLEPTSDGDDALPVWLANKRAWANDLKLLTSRDVHMELMISAFEETDVRSDAVIADLSWRESWVSP